MTAPLNRIIHWLTSLVQTPSVCPRQAGPKAGPPGEAALAELLRGAFQRLGAEVTIEEVLPDRPNVYGIWRGTAPRWAAVDVHMDTVGVEQMSDPPFDGRVEDGRVWGRGAVDTKATLAILLATLEMLKAEGSRPVPNLLIAATVNEESGGAGASAFDKWARARGIQPDQMITAEPTLCRPIHAHKGIISFTVRTHGQASHSAQPERGRNAIVAMSRIIDALAAEHERLQQIPPLTALGPATLAVTMISGGTGHNVVPDTCKITVNRRTVPGENVTDELARLNALVTGVSPLPVTFRSRVAQSAFHQPADSPWVQQLARWAGAEPGVAPYATNAMSYPGLAREMVIMGPGSIDQAHGPVEWVEISELEKMSEIYWRWFTSR